MTNFIALAIGFVVGIIPAQAIIHLQVSPDNAVCWDQTADSLDSARSMKVELTWDSTTPIIQSPICNYKGVTTSSPYECGVQIPMSAQAVGQHTLVYRVGNVEVDGSISYTSSVNSIYIIDPTLKGAPALPQNTTFLKKKLIALLELITKFFR